MSKSDDLEFLGHILTEVEFIISTTKNLSKNDFLENELLKRAVVRSFEIIGQATKNLDMDFRYKYPEIPWKFMAGMRDILIHEYMGVDYDLVFKTAKEDVIELHDFLTQIINEHNK